jgi:hypothetical protein
MIVRTSISSFLVSVALMGLVFLPADAMARRGKKKNKKPVVAEKVDNRGTLVIFTTTAGATLEIDGEPAGELSLDAQPRKMEPGQYMIRVHMRGWTEHSDVFIIKAGQETELEVDLIPVAGIVKVKTALAGATVTVNGKVLGVTGEKGLDRDVPAGDITMVISRPGYQPITKKLKVQAGKVLPPISVKLEPMMMVQAPGFYETWWFWTVVGVAVAGGATATVFAVQGEGPQPPTPDFTLQIP